MNLPLENDSMNYVGLFGETASFVSALEDLFCTIGETARISNPIET